MQPTDMLLDGRESIAKKMRPGDRNEDRCRRRSVCRQGSLTDWLITGVVPMTSGQSRD